MKKSALVLIVLLTALVNLSLAQQPSIMLTDDPGWQKIGEVKADFKAENESIEIFGKDVFKSILIKVTDAPINIENVQVFYESGETEEVNVRNKLKAGAETREIKLKHPDQALKKVVFTYNSLPNQANEKAHVELYGLREEK